MRMAPVRDSLHQDVPWYEDILACPDCLAEVQIAAGNIRCLSCNFHRDYEQVLDLQPQHCTRQICFDWPCREQFSSSVELENLDIDAPSIIYDGPPPGRNAIDILSELQRYVPSGAAVLDLGCGPRDQVHAVESLGCRYVGLDVSGDAADVLGDVHCLPFRQQTIDAVIGVAVLEHFRNPLLALREIVRVLKPGGVYIGSVSQGEPYHDSYFHMTALGLLSCIAMTPGLRVVKLWPGRDTIAALAGMGRYPRVIKALLALVNTLDVAVPVLAPNRKKAPRDRQLERVFRAGDIKFTIVKPH
jgi:SAM-dependent methyltransferase